MPTAVAAARQSYADHPMVRLETAPPGPCHAVSLQETLSGTFTVCATVILGHRRQAPGRVRHQLQVNKRRLDGGMFQPPAEVIQRYPVQQQVTGVAVPQRVSADVPAAIQPARVNRPLGRELDPPSGRRP